MRPLEGDTFLTQDIVASLSCHLSNAKKIEYFNTLISKSILKEIQKENIIKKNPYQKHNLRNRRFFSWLPILYMCHEFIIKMFFL